MYLTIQFCYNCRRWKCGSDYVVSLLNSCDICLIQEHWLLPDHLGALNISDDFLSFGISGIDNSDLLLGRPYGGCAILFRKLLSPLFLLNGWYAVQSVSALFRLPYPTVHLMTSLLP